MSGRFEGRTVVISGGARGQGRSHASAFAAEGANVVVFDVCADLGVAEYPASTRDELEATAAAVRDAGAKGFAEVADARDAGQMKALFDRAAAEFGTVDVVVANAGVVQGGAKAWEIDEQVFRTVLDVNVMGSWQVLKHGIATMRVHGTKGSVVVIGSGASIKGVPNIAAYVASKHALVGLVRTAAKDAAAEGIRVNLIAPGNTRTPMFLNDSIKRMFVPDVAAPSDELLAERAALAVPMRVPWVEPEDISAAVLYLASDAARYVTGTVLPVDAGTGVP